MTRKPRKARKPREPKPLKFGDWTVAQIEWAYDPSPRVDIDLAWTDRPQELGRLAAWLTKAAEWIKDQER